MSNRLITTLGLALALAAGTAVAAGPAQDASKAATPTKQASKEAKQAGKTCVKHNAMGHCEKWAPAKSETAAKSKEKKS